MSVRRNLPRAVRLVRSRPARRPAEREGDGADRRQGRADRHADRRRLAGDRSDVVRLAEMGAADGRRGRRDGAHRAQARRALPGADAEPERASTRRVRRAPTKWRCSSPRPNRFRKRNINCSIAESLERAQPIFEAAEAGGIRVRGYISVVLGCPYEGDVDPAAVADVAAALHAMGAYEVSLGDTIGTGTAGKTQALLRRVAERVPIDRLAGHFHDTYGQALANIYASLELGVATFDCSVAGLGGCPYAKGATGNVATEDVVYLLDGLGIETGVDMTKLRSAGPLHLRLSAAAEHVARRARARCAIRSRLTRRCAVRCARVTRAARCRACRPSANAPVASPCISVCRMDAVDGPLRRLPANARRDRRVGRARRRCAAARVAGDRRRGEADERSR